MENRDMIRMANQIAAFFEAYPRAEAIDGIGKHIKNFWDPRMRGRTRRLHSRGRRGTLAAGSRRLPGEGQFQFQGLTAKLG